jgi:hypothetical protein
MAEVKSKPNHPQPNHKRKPTQTQKEAQNKPQKA